MSSHRHQDQEWTRWEWSEEQHMFWRLRYLVNGEPDIQWSEVGEDPNATPRSVGGLSLAALHIGNDPYNGGVDGTYDGYNVDRGHPPNAIHLPHDPVHGSAPAPSKGKGKEKSDSKGKHKSSKGSSKKHRDGKRDKSSTAAVDDPDPFYETTAAETADVAAGHDPALDDLAAAGTGDDIGHGDAPLYELGPQDVPPGSTQPVDPLYGYSHQEAEGYSDPHWGPGGEGEDTPQDTIEPLAPFPEGDFPAQDSHPQDEYDQQAQFVEHQQHGSKRHKGKKNESKSHQPPEEPGLDQFPGDFNQAPAFENDNDDGDDDDDLELQKAIRESQNMAYGAGSAQEGESSSQAATAAEEAYQPYLDQAYEAAYPQDHQQQEQFYGDVYPPEHTGELTPRAGTPRNDEVSTGTPDRGEEYDDYGRIINYDIKGNAHTGAFEELDDRYVVEHSMKFQPGAVFKVLWSEPLGQGSDSQLRQEKMTEFQERMHMGQRFYVGFRRFIVIANDEGHCTCVPILTYERRACTKKGVKAQKHGVVHAVGTKPRTYDHEPALGFLPVRVQLEWASEKLAWQSRINYSKLVTIEHNVKVFFIGHIIRDDFDTVRMAVDQCWDEKMRKQGKNHYGKGRHR